jgi:hypothetical protein
MERAQADPSRGGVAVVVSIFSGLNAIPGRLICHEVSSSRKLYRWGRGDVKKRVVQAANRQLFLS